MGIHGEAGNGDGGETLSVMGVEDGDEEQEGTRHPHPVPVTSLGCTHESHMTHILSTRISLKKVF